MKRKNLYKKMMLCTLIATVSLNAFGCKSDDEKKENEATKEEDFMFVTNDEYWEEDGDYKYSSDILKGYKYTKKENEKITDIYNLKDVTYYISDSKIYAVTPDLKTEVIRPIEDDSEKIVLSTDRTEYKNWTATVDKDGKYRLYGTNGGSVIEKGFEIPGENLITAINVNGDIVIVHVVDGEIEETIVSAATMEMHTIEELTHKCVYGNGGPVIEGKIREVFTDGSYYTLYLMDDGRVFRTDSFMITADEKDEKMMYVELMKETEGEEIVPYLSNVSKIHAAGNLSTFDKPVYEKINVTDALYTSVIKANITTSETSFEEMEIKLPADYDTEDIKAVKASHSFIIEFDDGSVYVSMKESPSKLVLSEELTKLNKEGSIVDIGSNQYGFLAVMDDGCLYALMLHDPDYVQQVIVDENGNLVPVDEKTEEETKDAPVSENKENK